jgi:hypothetical protein
MVADLLAKVLVQSVLMPPSPHFKCGFEGEAVKVILVNIPHAVAFVKAVVRSHPKATACGEIKALGKERKNIAHN